MIPVVGLKPTFLLIIRYIDNDDDGDDNDDDGDDDDDDDDNDDDDDDDDDDYYDNLYEYEPYEKGSLPKNIILL